MINNQNFSINKVQQQGAVLIMSLILLVVLTLIGVSAMDTTKLQTRMAANTAISNCAFQVANTGLDYVYGQYDQATTDNDNAVKQFSEENWGVPPLATEGYDSPGIGSDSTIKGHADFLIKKVSNESGANKNLFFVVKSTGYCKNDPDHTAKLIEGWSYQAPKSTDNYEEKFYSDLPTLCYNGYDQNCKDAIAAACQNAATLPPCQEGDDPTTCTPVGEEPELTEEQNTAIDACTKKLITQAGGVPEEGETEESAPADPDDETGESTPADPDDETGESTPADPDDETGESTPADPDDETGDT